jgi:hypothetical protein
MAHAKHKQQAILSGPTLFLLSEIPLFQHGRLPNIEIDIVIFQV